MLIQSSAGTCGCPTVPPLPPTITPEPATVALLGAGLALLALLAWRRERLGRGGALLGLLLASWGMPGVAGALMTGDDPCVCPPDSPTPPVVSDRDGGGFPGWAIPLGLGAIVGTGWTLGDGRSAAAPSDPGAPFGGPLGATGNRSPVPAPLPVSLLAPAAPAVGDAPVDAAERPVAEPGPLGSAPVLAAIARRPAAPGSSEADGLAPPATAQGWAAMLLAGMLAVVGGAGLLLPRRRPRETA